MSSYLTKHAPGKTPQTEKLPGSSQTQNSAEGFSWEIDKWSRLNRFLILGSEGGSYYASERKLTTDNVQCITECLTEDGPRTVAIIVAISEEGRAPKNDQAIYALAMAASYGEITDKPHAGNTAKLAEWHAKTDPILATRAAAFDAIPKVCRIGTHIFQFVTFVQSFRGWGRGLRTAVGNWYTEKDANQIAYQVVKYRNRDGWTHRDLLRETHPKSDDGDVASVLRWTAKGDVTNSVMPKIIHGFEKIQAAKTAKEAAALVVEYGLPREAVPTELLNSTEVWEAMLFSGGKYGMPIGAMIRNLATMTRIGLLKPGSQATKRVVETLRSEKAITHARIHPIAVLAALKTYASGYSVRGSNTWSALPAIVDALDDAFYLSFGNVEATGKSRLIALDVSGSMGGGYVAGVPGLTPRIASAAMAMVSMKTGDPYEVVAFTGGNTGYWDRSGRAQSGDDLSVLSLSPRQRLDDIVRAISGLPFGGTDCALPMLYATQQGREVDVFEIYTDSETWTGAIHPSEALKMYRRASGKNAKLVVIGMVSNGFSIADPNDSGMLDVVGMDTATPSLISAFAGDSF